MGGFMPINSFVNNPKIKVSLHAKKKFLEMITPDITASIPFSAKLDFAEQMIRDIWKGSAYYLDNHKGIIFCNKQYGICLFIKDGCVTTVNKADKVIRKAA
jgi:hypothetical protein